MRNHEEILKLIGRVASFYIREELRRYSDADDKAGILRFDSLSEDLLVECINSIARQDFALSDIDIVIPRNLVPEEKIEHKEVLFDGNPAGARNKITDKRLLLFANNDNETENIEDTLRQVRAIREKDLLFASLAWRETLSEKFPELRNQRGLLDQIEAMFSAFNLVMGRSLEISASFLINIVDDVLLGTTIDVAVSDNLNEIGFPKYLSAMPSCSSFGEIKAWMKSFELVNKIPLDILEAASRPIDLSIDILKDRFNSVSEDLAANSQALKIYSSLIREDGRYAWEDLKGLDWVDDYLKEFVIGDKSEVKKSLGEKTLDQIEDCEGGSFFLDSNILNNGKTYRYYLENLNTNFDEKGLETARQFYNSAYQYILRDAKLDRSWDKLLFREKLEGDNFIDLVVRAALQLIGRIDLNKITDPVLLLNCRANLKDLSEKNKCLLGYFCYFYKGIENQCSDFIKFGFKGATLKKTGGLNPLFHLDTVFNGLSKKTEKRASISKSALELSFDAYVVDRSEITLNHSGAKTVRLVWRLQKNTVALRFARDIDALFSESNKNQFGYLFKTIYGRNFKQSNSRGLISSASLYDYDSFGVTGGQFIYKNYTYQTDLESAFNNLLEYLESQNAVAIDLDNIRGKWERFKKSYKKAIEMFKCVGFGDNSIVDEYSNYVELLKVISSYAESSQEFRSKAFSHLLSLGVFSFVDDCSAYAAVVPWNPIRLYDLHCDFLAKIYLIKNLIKSRQNVHYNVDNFVKNLTKSHEHFWPAFVVSPANPTNGKSEECCNEILSPVEHVSGYSLFSRTVGPNSCESGVDVSSVKDLVDVAINNYLDLMPNSSNCLTIALPDVVSSVYPLTLAKDLISNMPEEQQLMIVVGGLNAEGYSDKTEEALYQGLTRGTSQNIIQDEDRSVSVNLKSRVQFSVVKKNDNFFEQNYSEKIPPYDLVFIDRFFTYSAKLDWVELPKRVSGGSPYNISDRLQYRSRRLVQLESEYMSTTLLCGDSVSEENHSYIDAVSWLINNKSALRPENIFSYPCLRIDCNKANLSNSIKCVHGLARWVVTSNQLIDRRQLINNKIKIVRYKKDNKSDRTSIVSSMMATDNLPNRIADRIREIDPHFNNDKSQQIAQKVLDESYRISGYVALRSAKLDTCANEILGLVLSDWIAKSYLRECSEAADEKVIAIGAFLIDDYASYFKNNGYLADLLCLALTEKDGNKKLRIFVTEAKFCSCDNISVTKNRSREQLLATLSVLYTSLVDKQSQLERSIWLGRLADMVLSFSKDDMNSMNETSKSLIEFSDAIKKGEFELLMCGASHVFIHDEEKTLDVSDLQFSDEAVSAHQLTICASDLTKLLNNFVSGSNDSIKILTLSNPEFSSHLYSSPIKLVSAWQLEGETEKLDSVSSTVVETKLQNDSDCSSEDCSRLEESVTSVVQDCGCGINTDNNTINVRENSDKSIKVVQDQQVFAPSFSKYINQKASSVGYSVERQAWAKKATNELRFFLLEIGIKAKVKRSTLTPNGCLVVFEGDEKLNDKAIGNFKEILLTTKGINVVFSRPGPLEYLIFFNDASGKRESVSMWDAWKRREVKSRQGGINFSFVIGLKETDGELLYLNPIEQDPHTLIAGGTGSGKTVLMQTMLLDMAATNPSSKLKFYIIDPKNGIDYGPLQNLPHMAEPLISNKEAAKQLLVSIVNEMERRYELFAKVGAKNLARYNAKVGSEQQLPALFVVHDELPNWMSDPEYSKSVTEAVIQLATKSRASGIYLIFMAQRPDKDVIPMQVRDNLGNRLVLKIPANTSEIALGEKGAENLLGRGHMAAKLGGTVFFAQVPYLDEESGELEKAVELITEADKEWS